MSVYKAINAVQKDLASSGIGKNQVNTFDKYKFRGIDDVYNALAPLLAKHGLLIMPRIISRDVVERESQKGGALFYVTVDAEFDFIAAEDGSKHTVKVFGEAMDRGDKGTNKAMSAAYKYAMFEAFCIPTEAQDADAESHQVVAKKKAEGQPTSGVWEAYEDKERILEIASIVREFHEAADMDGLMDYLDRQALETDCKAALWTQLDSKVRSAIKKATADRKVAA